MPLRDSWDSSFALAAITNCAILLLSRDSSNDYNLLAAECMFLKVIDANGCLNLDGENQNPSK